MSEADDLAGGIDVGDEGAGPVERVLADEIRQVARAEYRIPEERAIARAVAVIAKYSGR